MYKQTYLFTFIFLYVCQCMRAKRLSPCNCEHIPRTAAPVDINTNTNTNNSINVHAHTMYTYVHIHTHAIQIQIQSAKHKAQKADKYEDKMCEPTNKATKIIVLPQVWGPAGELNWCKNNNNNKLQPNTSQLNTLM